MNILIDIFKTFLKMKTLDLNGKKQNCNQKFVTIVDKKITLEISCL